MKEKIAEAKQLFSADIVSDVLNAVYLFDADGCYSTFQDMGMDDHAECTEFIFFN